MDVITYPCWDYSQSILVKEASYVTAFIAPSDYKSVVYKSVPVYIIL